MAKRGLFRPLPARKIIAILLRVGFVPVRQSGSHRSFRHFKAPRLVVVPIHKGKDLPSGTVKTIIKQAGLTEKEFVDLL